MLFRSLDPLRPAPRPYEAVGCGWSIFSPPFYQKLARLGVRRGADMFAAMVDNRHAFVVTDRWRAPNLLKMLRSTLESSTVNELDSSGKGNDAIVLLQIVSSTAR